MVFYLSVGCERDSECGGSKERGECNGDNQCVCNKGFYGLRCDYSFENTCEDLEINEAKERFRGSREYANEYKLFRDEQGVLLVVYDHPVYISKAEEGEGIDLILYNGIRWLLIHASTGFAGLRNPRVADLFEFLSKRSPQEITNSIGQVEFVSEPVRFNSPEDASNPSPIGLEWSYSHGSSLNNTDITGPSATTLICSICSNTTNPCLNGNTCSSNGSCDCTNGAEGTLCQVTPLGNGHCDTYFNTPTFSYDGGDCCEATCVSAAGNTCGVLNRLGNLESVFVGFPHCEDVGALCEGDCWGPKSQNIITESDQLTALVMLTNNDKIMVVSEPALDVVRVYDQIGSEWFQRGPVIEGKRASNFGRIVAVSALPSQVISRRFGKIPLLLAMPFFSAPGETSIRIVRWRANDIDWQNAGIIRLCGNGCKLESIEVGSEGSLGRLVVRMDDGSISVYESEFTNEQVTNWELFGELEGLPEDSTSLSGDGTTFVIQSGLDLIAYDLRAQNDTFYEQISTFHLGDTEYVGCLCNYPEFANVGDDDGVLWDTQNSLWVVEIDVQAMKVDARGLFFSFSAIVKRKTGAFEHHLSHFKVRKDVKDVRLQEVTIGAVPTDLEAQAVFSDDAKTIVFVKEGEAQKKLSLFSYRYTEENQNQFLPIGAPYNMASKASFSISESGPTLVVSDSGEIDVMTASAQCGTGQVDVRLSISLDENPANTTWKVETLRHYGNQTYIRSVDAECNNCYSPSDRFARTRISDGLCINEPDRDCLRLTYQAAAGISEGAGFAFFMDGTIVGQHDRNTSEQVLIHPPPSSEGPSACVEQKAQCEPGHVAIGAVLKLDNYAVDTSWTLQDIGGRMLMEGANYTVREALHIDQTCVPQDSCLVFSIYDQWGDGFCCKFGDGEYSIFWDEQLEFKRIGDFEKRRLHVFGRGCTDQCFVETDDGYQPTSTSSLSDSLQGCEVQRTACGADETLLTTAISLDKFPGDISWRVVDALSYEEILPDTSLEEIPPMSTVVRQACLPTSTCVLHTVADSTSRGFCCEEGEGSYSVMYGSQTPFKRSGDFRHSETFAFGDGCPEFVQVTIGVQLDLHSDETSWKIFTANNALVATVPFDYYIPDESDTLVHSTVDYLLPDTEYFFEMYDSYGDGIADGHFTIYLGTEANEDNILVSGDGYFNETSPLHQFVTSLSDVQVAPPAGAEVVTTNAPVSTTSAPVGTTGVTVAPVGAQVATTNAPVVTTNAPVVTTGAQAATTNAPIPPTNVTAPAPTSSVPLLAPV